jgi:hypothetical protein
MMAGRLSILYYTGPVLMMLPPCCGWSVCSIVVYYKDTAHTFFQSREIEKITSSDYSVFGTGFSIVVGALFLIFFSEVHYRSTVSAGGMRRRGGEIKFKKTRVIEFALTFFFFFLKI